MTGNTDVATGSRNQGAIMKTLLWVLVVALAPFVYATEWGAQLPWNMKDGFSEWQRCRYRGVDLIGTAKLINIDPLQTNDHGVVATFQFTDMLKGLPGNYTITIPDGMRNPMEMTVDLGEWKWEMADTYGILCISNEYYEIRMVDWVVPLEKWEAFKASAEKERVAFEKYVKEKKMERLELEQKSDEMTDRDDIEREEKEVRREIINTRIHEIHTQMQEKAEPYYITGIDWYDLDQTWPIAVDEKEQMKSMLGL
jgi:hypothetical protein